MVALRRCNHGLCGRIPLGFPDGKWRPGNRTTTGCRLSQRTHNHLLPPVCHAPKGIFTRSRRERGGPESYFFSASPSSPRETFFRVPGVARHHDHSKIAPRLTSIHGSPSPTPTALCPKARGCAVLRATPGACGRFATTTTWLCRRNKRVVHPAQGGLRYCKPMMALPTPPDSATR